MRRGERICPGGAEVGGEQDAPTAQASGPFLKALWSEHFMSVLHSVQASVVCIQDKAPEALLGSPFAQPPKPPRCPSKSFTSSAWAQRLAVSGLPYAHLTGPTQCREPSHLSRPNPTHPYDTIPPSLSFPSPVPSPPCAYSFVYGVVYVYTGVTLSQSWQHPGGRSSVSLPL